MIPFLAIVGYIVCGLIAATIAAFWWDTEDAWDDPLVMVFLFWPLFAVAALVMVIATIPLQLAIHIAQTLKRRP